MIPNITTLTEEITEVNYPSRTYKINLDKDRISGYTDDLDAIKQAIYLILSTERYQHIIYSWDYGVELLDLIGKPIPYVMSELPRRIKEALTQDNRISDVVDFEFQKLGKKLNVTFKVITTLGNFITDLNGVNLFDGGTNDGTSGGTNGGASGGSESNEINSLKREVAELKATIDSISIGLDKIIDIQTDLIANGK